MNKVAFSRSLDHLTCAWHGLSPWAEVGGHIDTVGGVSTYHLAPVRLMLRKGKEAQDLDAILAYLTKNRARILSSFKPPELSLDDLLGTTHSPAKRRR